jgi:hypothetical protein
VQAISQRAATLRTSRHLMLDEGEATVRTLNSGRCRAGRIAHAASMLGESAVEPHQGSETDWRDLGLAVIPVCEIRKPAS